MRKLSEPDPVKAVTVLSVSSDQEDQSFLSDIFSHSNWWFYKASTIAEALTALEQHKIAVVLCEHHLGLGTWKDFLRQITRMPYPPALIVTSRLADDHLWVEALNLGAYNVLDKPFDSEEVFRVVSVAWLHWKNKYQLATDA